MSEELSISPVLSYQVDGGDQESHQLSSQVEPAASKGREGQSHRLKQGRAGSAVNINKRGRWKQESPELIKQRTRKPISIWDGKWEQGSCRQGSHPFPVIWKRVKSVPVEPT